MPPLDLGIDFDELEKLAQPPLLPDGKYEVIVEEVVDSPVKKNNRPQWKVTFKVMNRPDFPNARLFIYTQLPWQDPSQGGQWDYSNTFTLVNLIQATGMRPQGKSLPEKEMLKGRALVVDVTQRPREDDPETMANRVKIVTPRKGGGVVA